jgi:hypothetical protein
MRDPGYSLHDVIQSLRPDNQFTMFEDNPETIIWNDQDVITPSNSEIEAAKIAFKAAREAEAQAKAQAKAVLLERLGLTQEEFNTLTA